MFAWFQKWFGHTPVRTLAASSRAAAASGVAPASNWNARLYTAAHHHFYRSLIQVRPTPAPAAVEPDASEQGEVIQAPNSQTGIDLEGLEPGSARLRKRRLKN